jgi:hypothetical protein
MYSNRLPVRRWAAGMAAALSFITLTGLVGLVGLDATAPLRAQAAVANPTATPPATAGSGVKTGAVFVLRGKVKVKHRRARPVRLQERVAGKWRVAAKRKTTSTGTFAFTVSAGATARARVFRFYAPKSPGLKAFTSAARTVKVTKPTGTSVPVGSIERPTGDWDPAEYPIARTVRPGRAADWSWGGASPSRWNPCATINWAYNPTGGYPSALTDLKRAFALIAGVTGLHFKYVGTTTVYTPAGGILPGNANIAVGWSTPSKSSFLSGATVAHGEFVSIGIGDGYDVGGVIYNGDIALDKTEVKNMSPGMALTKTSWGRVMVHELGHVVGLGHSRFGDEVMYYATHSGPTLFGNGDIAGFKRVGSTSGCLPNPYA